MHNMAKHVDRFKPSLGLSLTFLKKSLVIFWILPDFIFAWNNILANAPQVI